MGVGADRILKLWFFSHWRNNSSFQSQIWGKFDEIWTKVIQYLCVSSSSSWTSLCSLCDFTLCMIMLSFVKYPFGGNGIFSVDSNDPYIFLSLCCKLVTFRWVEKCVNNIRDCTFIIIHQLEKYFSSYRW